MKIKVSKLPGIVAKFPINELKTKCNRRLWGPAKRANAIHFGKHNTELLSPMRAIINEFGRQFGTLVVEVEAHLVDQMSVKNKNEIEQTLGNLIEFIKKNKTFCEVKYLEMAKKELEALKKGKDGDKGIRIKQILQNRIMDTKLSILAKELPTKREMFENAKIGDIELATFMPDFHAELSQAGKTNSYWANESDQIMNDYLQKAEELFRLANELTKPLKKIAGEQMEELIKGLEPEISKLISLIDDQENSEELSEKLEKRVDKIKEIGSKAMEIVLTIDTPKKAEICKTAEEMEKAIKELEKNTGKSDKMNAKMRKLKKLLENDKKQFVERPYKMERKRKGI
ncbi:hypothetical protein niasHS_017876 [Heterodera schachtii]|uniref:Uncharacterized protein n=2 Tax=Heterodera TaxID=34509 RepID=A0ABD2I4S8_HETSC